MGYMLVEPAEGCLDSTRLYIHLIVNLFRWQSFAYGAVFSMTCEHITVQRQGLP
jgi:hypothetical protein